MEEQDEETIIAFVKENGTVPIPIHSVRSRTSAILKIMKQNGYNLRILRIGCHSISNIAMEIQNCEILVREGVIECVLMWIEEFITDWRICWLACSSLWNLARCKLARDRINVRGVSLVLDIIDLHSHSPLVMQTSLGALSNLCIDAHIKRKIGNDSTIQRCFQLMERHPYDSKVLTSACGLITNLAYDEEIAQNISGNGIHKIVTCMLRHKRVNHLQRNASAALSNLSATPLFVQHLVTCDGVEALFEALKHHQMDSDVTQLATGALQNLSIYGPTTSLHVASTFCDCLIARQVLLNKWDDFMDVNCPDIFGDTPIHSAIRAILSISTTNNSSTTGYDKAAMADRLDVLQFLVAAGGSILIANKKNETPLSLVKLQGNENDDDERKKNKTENDSDNDNENVMIQLNDSSESSGDEDMLIGHSVGDTTVVNIDIADLNERSLRISRKKNLMEKRINTAIGVAIHQGQRHLRIVQKRFCNLVTQTRKDIPREIANILGEYCHPLELSIAFRVELEPSFKLAKHSKSMARDSVHVCMNFDHCTDLMDVDL